MQNVLLQVLLKEISVFNIIHHVQWSLHLHIISEVTFLTTM